MDYVRLGRTGLEVSRICLGCMSYGVPERGSHPWSMGEEQSRPFIKRALELGITFFDTANVYSDGTSEEIVGRALKDFARREEVVIATKLHGRMRPGPNGAGLSRRAILGEIDNSLRRLGTDYVDLYQIHALDAVTPIEETVRALDDLVRQGHVRYVGVSNWSAWTLMKALGIADRQGWARPVTLQAYYTIAGRDLEREIAPLLQAEKLGLMVWSPLAGGLLSGKYDREGNGPAGSRRASFDFPPVERDRAFACIDAMREVAAAHGVSVARVALAWVLQRPFVMSVIIGAKTVEQLDDNLAATEVTLAPAELELLDQVSALSAEYPGWMIERQNAVRAGFAHAKPNDA